MRGNPRRTDDFLAGRLPFLSVSDLAIDTDNSWTDGATVDAHTYAGMVYDYYFKQFGRRGLDDFNIPIVSLVHPVRRGDFDVLGRDFPDFFANAFWSPARRVMVYGVGLPPGVASQDWDFLSGALDVVAHELTHGVTEFSSSLIYLNESGALNEAFSDIMATGAEFFFQPPGSGLLRADYLGGEDVVRPGGIRSLQDPGAYGDPDHTRLRCCVGIADLDSGGVHINSGIPNNAFYLAIEGGANRTSGQFVQGVGSANRDQIERVFYRAFAYLLPSNANFLLGRAATIQSARELFGPGSIAERAVTQAWDAVGVRPRSAVEVSFWPNPVPQSPFPCADVQPSWDLVTSVLTPPVGYIVDSWDLNFYSAAGGRIDTARLSESDFVEFFQDCSPGSTRIPGNSEACSWVCVNLGGRSSGSIDVVIRGARDDAARTSLTVTSARLPLLATGGPLADEGQTFGEPALARLP
jgi:hypothetical protein